MATKYSFQAKDATRESILLRAAFCGVTGSGKTRTAMILATQMIERLSLGPLYVIDTEHESALRYAYSPRSRTGYRFKHVPMPADDNSPAAYLAALEYCEAQGAGVIIIDSFSHMWAGIGGVLERVDQTTAQSRTKNAFSEGWKAWTPIHLRAVERIMQSSAHVLLTLRAKQEWVVQTNDRGKAEPKKLGMGAVAREGTDYEPDFFFLQEQTGKGRVLLTVQKTRAIDVERLEVGTEYTNPAADFADEMIAWLRDVEPTKGAPARPAPALGSASAALERITAAATIEPAARAGEPPRAEIPFDVEAAGGTRAAEEDPFEAIADEAGKAISTAADIAGVMGVVDTIEAFKGMPVERVDAVRQVAIRRCIVVAADSRSLAAASTLAKRTVAPDDWHAETGRLYKARRAELAAPAAGVGVGA